MRSVAFARQLSFLLLSTCLLFSCRVSLVPEYNAQLEDQIIKAAKETDKLYIDLLDAAPDLRHYTVAQPRYSEIEAEINSIELKNQGRIKNGDFLVIIKNLKEAFLEAKKFHKDHETLSNGEILAYQATLAGFWKPLYLAEKALK